MAQKNIRKSKFSANDDNFTYSPLSCYIYDDFAKLSITKVQSVAHSLMVPNASNKNKRKLINAIICKHIEKRNRAKEREIVKEEAQIHELQLCLQHATLVKSNPIFHNQARSMLPMEELYIMTTLQYEPQYIYKIGCSANIPQSIKSLDMSRLKNDQLFICYRAQCMDSISAENYAHKLLAQYRKVNSPEFFVVEFNVLRRLIDIVCKSFCNIYNEWVEIFEIAGSIPLPSINQHQSFHVSSVKMT